MRPVVDRSLPDGGDRARADARMRERLSRPDPGPLAERLALLHFTGRRSGRPYTVPAGVHRLGEALVVATGSAWRHNFAGGADGELTWRGRRTPVRFVLVTDAERTARGYLELYERYGDAAERRLGIAVTGEPAPGHDEFSDAVTRCGLSLIEVGPRTTDTANERTPR
ncbi:mycobacterial cell wall protein Rv0580c [Streptomyces prasinosporus]|uniref:Mycobacterial cell wall protein Rv0580c n=1 Tax=Streptomyces prasinosporus TaxID=68256 RepID=A0ABP6U279_9ACTN